MTNPVANRLTHSHRADLRHLIRSTSGHTRSVAARADFAAVADWWAQTGASAVEDIVMRGHTIAAQLTVRYMFDHARASGATTSPIPATLNLEAMHGALFVNGVGAFLSHLRRTGSVQSARRVMTSGLIGSVTKYVLAGQRDTLLGTFRAGR